MTDVSGRFACGDEGRALFEAGVKMGSLYHQFVGAPVSAKTAGVLEEAIASSVEAQPCVVSAVVTIDRSRLPPGDGEFDYASLTGDMIDAVVVVRVGESTVTAEMRYDPDLDYPLMFVSSISRRF